MEPKLFVGYNVITRYYILTIILKLVEIVYILRYFVKCSI